MKLLSSLLFISFLFSASFLTLQAEQNGATPREVVGLIMNGLKNVKFGVDSTVRGSCSYVKIGTDNLDNFFTQNPEKAGIAVVGTAASCYLLYKVFNSEKFKSFKKDVACLLNGIKRGTSLVIDKALLNLKYLGRNLLPQKLALWAFQEAVIKNCGKGFGTFLAVSSLKFLELCHENNVLLDMPLAQDMSAREVGILIRSWGMARGAITTTKLYDRLEVFQ